MSETLRPCPFCGGPAELDFAHRVIVYTDRDGNKRETGFFYTVKCQDVICGCAIGVYEDADMAVEAWNRRKDG